MSFLEDLDSGVENVLRSPWDLRDGQVVPSSDGVALNGGGVHLNATILYADLAQSSKLATDFQQRTAAKIMKAFLFCCSKIISAHDGTITSFDGDRVMGVFVGNLKNTNAATTALKIKYVVEKIIKPKVVTYFSSMKETSYEINHAVGIDTSKVLVVRAGQRGSNDLIWVGRSPNLAAKLSEIREQNYHSYITEDVYNMLNDSAKNGGSEKKDMWEKCSYPWIGSDWTVYRSSWYWKP